MQDVQRAKDLCEDLLANVKNQYERFKEQSLQRVYGSGLQRDRHHDYGVSYRRSFKCLWLTIISSP